MKISTWKVYDKSMLYPGGNVAIPYSLWWKKDGDIQRFRFIIGCDTPQDEKEEAHIREMAFWDLEGIIGINQIQILIRERMIDIAVIFIDDKLGESIEEIASYLEEKGT